MNLLSRVALLRGFVKSPVTTFLAIFLAAATAQGQIQQPQLGTMLDSEGMLRPVYGIAASASLGNPRLAGVSSFACSSTLCLAKTGTAVVAFLRAPGGGQSNASSTPCVCPGPALIALDAQGGAWTYFPSTLQLAHWQNGALTPINFAPDGQILALRATADGFDYALIQDDAIRLERGIPREAPEHPKNIVWIEHYSSGDGSVAIVDSLGTSGPVMLLDGGILFSSGNQVILRRPDGQELGFSLSGASVFQAAGSGTVEINASGGMWILRTDPGKEQLSLLPGTPQTNPHAPARDLQGFLSRGRGGLLP